MLTLLFLLLMLLVVVTLISGAGRRRRRVHEAAEERARRAAARGSDPLEGASPFEMLPFGGLLESLMMGVGARSFQYDPETGEWVEVSDEHPVLDEQPEPAQAKSESTARRPRSRPKRQAASPFGPLGGLMGGMGGGLGGSGEFEVESPEELDTFEDVGGMEALKQELRQTVGGKTGPRSSTGRGTR